MRKKPPHDTVQLTTDSVIESEQGPRRPYLIVIRGENVGARYPVGVGGVLLGRDPAAQVMLRDEVVSWHHARVEFTEAEGQFQLVDLESTNGTLLNGNNIDCAPLREGDKIFVGSTILKFDFVDRLEGDFQRQVESLISVDQLTGLARKGRFDEEFLKEFLSAELLAKPLSVLMMDMDGLKRINELHGHEAGSHALATTAETIRRALQKYGMVARFGGDEFVCFMRDTPKRQAGQVAESVRRAVEDLRIRYQEFTLRVSVSIGVATFPDDAQSAEDLVRMADEALYLAKDAGKNSVACC